MYEKFLIMTFLFLIKDTFLQTCGSKDPKNYSDCSEDSNSESVCCYSEVSLMNTTNTLCVLVPKSQAYITPYITAMDIGLGKDKLILMNVDCNIEANVNSTGRYTKCGELNPKTEDDCLRYSSKNASCCYIRSPDGNSVCLWNDGVYKHNSTYFGTQVICTGSYLKNTKIILSLVFIFLLFIL